VERPAGRTTLTAKRLPVLSSKPWQGQATFLKESLTLEREKHEKGKPLQGVPVSLPSNSIFRARVTVLNAQDKRTPSWVAAGAAEDAARAPRAGVWWREP